VIRSYAKHAPWPGIIFEHWTLIHSSFLPVSFIFFYPKKIERNVYTCVNPWNAMAQPIALSCSVCHVVALHADSEPL